jgi:hypothetical protein
MKRWLNILVAASCMASVSAFAAASATQPDAQASAAQSSYGVAPLAHKKRAKKPKKAPASAPASAAAPG